MKTLKVFFNGQPLRNIYPHATRFQVIKYKVGMFLTKLTKTVIGFSIGTAVMSGFFWAGQAMSTKVVMADPIDQPKVIAPVLARIARAESHNSHFCTPELVKVKMCAKSEVGQVLTRANKDKTVDVGKYQINLYHWGKAASDKGLHLFNEKDNETMAVWLLSNYGSEPWSASKSGWNK